MAHDKEFTGHRVRVDSGMIGERIVLIGGRTSYWLAIAAAAAMALHVSAEIVARSVFGTALGGTIEMVSYVYMVAVSFLPLGHVQTRRDHIAADAIANAVPRAIRSFTDFVGRLLSIAVTAFLFWAVADMAIRQTRINEVVEAAYFDIPIWPSRWLLPIGLGSMLIVMILQLFQPTPAPAIVHDQQD